MGECPRGTPVKFQARPENLFVLEGLEPRVLLSAGPASLSGERVCVPHPEAGFVSSAAEEASLSQGSIPTDPFASGTGLVYGAADQVEDIFAGVPEGGADAFQAASETVTPAAGQTGTPADETSGTLVDSSSGGTSGGDSRSDSSEATSTSTSAGAEAQTGTAAQLVEGLTAANGPPGALTEVDPISNLSGLVNLPGLRLVNSDLGLLAGQEFFLDFGGVTGATYDGPVRVENVDVPAFRAPAELSGREQFLIAALLRSLNQTFSALSVHFTTFEASPAPPHSVIHIGGDGAAFAQYGSFLGLAEKVDVGNRDRGDEAFIFSDKLAGYGLGEADYLTALSAVVEHEARHLLGFEHTTGDTTGLNGVAAVVAQGPAGASWTPAGPEPVRNAQDLLGTTNQVTGAIQAVLAHPTDPDVIYVGAVDGGVWRTTNATTATPIWTPLTDQFPSLAIGALGFDLSNPRHCFLFYPTMSH